MTIEQEILTLRKEIEEHNFNYYNLDLPTISDFDFDLLLRKLIELESKNPEFFDANSPSQRVGGSITKKFNSVAHKNKMYSLDNAYSFEELEDWEKRISKIIENRPITYTCELKYDGVSISIEYKEGNLFQALTRGDG
ncbi:MAG: NAD-dependent DNA ligase LigA, partial [Solirubrobacteraceae bacterium]